MSKISETKTFIASLDSLEPMREFLSESGNKVGLDKNQIYKLCLAVDEIATNIINYGYLKEGIITGIIDIVIYSDDKILTVILEDNSTPFNPLEFNIPGEDDLSLPLEERPIGGLGIMLAKESVDEFKYDFKNGKNINIFCVKFPDN
ncbi:MAG: ATP-binding protein [Bacteroidota bacterium]